MHQLSAIDSIQTVAATPQHDGDKHSDVSSWCKRHQSLSKLSDVPYRHRTQTNKSILDSDWERQGSPGGPNPILVERGPASPCTRMPVCDLDKPSISTGDDRHSSQNNQDDEEDSYSCEWSVASSESSVFWEEDEDNESLNIALDEYIEQCMKRAEQEEAAAAAARPRVVKFCESVVSDVRYYVKPTAKECCGLFYTGHELQRMIDDFVRDGGSKLLG